MKYPSTAKVCSYVQQQTGQSIRSIASQLGIHHTSWLRYSKGERAFTRKVKSALLRLMHVASYQDLLRSAYRPYRQTNK